MSDGCVGTPEDLDRSDQCLNQTMQLHREETEAQYLSYKKQLYRNGMRESQLDWGPGGEKIMAGR